MRPDDGRQSKNEDEYSKIIRNRRVCYDCGTAISNPDVAVCPNPECRSSDIDERRSRPRRVEPGETVPLPHPWSKLKLEQGGTVLLSGNAGSGKTSICMAAKPTRYISSEQEVGQVAQSWYRINPNDPSPIISNCHTWDHLEEDLLGIDEDDLIVVDSISQFASGDEASMMTKRVIEIVRAAKARAIFIAQFRKDGAMLGPNEIRHQVDAIATIPDDKTGLRRLSMEKNRFGGLFATYFGLSARGVTIQEFPYAYTVEGSAGKYGLHLFPLSGGKLTGIFDSLVRAGVHLEGFASAAVACEGYRTGFAEPSDTEWRRSFAEDHGLEWISPERAKELIEQANLNAEEASP